jgi:hypothetical protein
VDAARRYVSMYANFAVEIENILHECCADASSRRRCGDVYCVAVRVLFSSCSLSAQHWEVWTEEFDDGMLRVSSRSPSYILFIFLICAAFSFGRSREDFKQDEQD